MTGPYDLACASDLVRPPDEPPRWRGSGLDPYDLGDPGRAAREVGAALPAAPNDLADTRIHGGIARGCARRASTGSPTGTLEPPRQNDYALAAADDWLVVAVADGVSAGELSHQAATLACRGGRDSGEGVAGGRPRRRGNRVGRRPRGGGRAASSRTVCARSNARRRGIDASDVARAMSTTLVIAVLRTSPDENGLHRGQVLAFGDCSVFMRAHGAGRAITSVKIDGGRWPATLPWRCPSLPEDPPPRSR